MKFLKNDYKIIYSSKKDGDLHLYATKNLPVAEDVKLVYVNEEGTELSADELKAIKFIYSKQNEGKLAVYYSENFIPAEADHRLAGFVNGELVFGDENIQPGDQYELTINEIEHAVITGAGKYGANTEATITLKPADGYKFGNTNAPKIDGNAMEADGDNFKYAITIGEADVNVTISDVEIVEAEKPAALAAYSYLGTEVASEITAAFVGMDSVDGTAEVRLSIPAETGSSNSYALAFAVREDIGKIVGIYQDTLPNVNLLDTTKDAIFVEKAVIYNEKNYNLYIQTEVSKATETAQNFDFCFVLR